MATFIKNMENSAASRGYDQARANRAVNVTTLGEIVDDDEYSDPYTIGMLTISFS